MRDYLAKFIDISRKTSTIASHLASDQMWVAESGSEAGIEISVANASLGNALGKDAIRTTYAIAQMGIVVCSEYLSSVAKIMENETSPLPLEVIARAAIEIAASTWWVMEPGIGARRRICRMQLLRINCAIELRKAIEEIGLQDDREMYGATEQQVIQYSADLGIRPFENNNARCEEDVRPSYTARARSLLDRYGAYGAYRIYSGTAHGELWALWRHFRDTSDDSGSDPLMNLVPNKFGTHAAVNGALVSVVSQLDAVGNLFGWQPDGPQGAHFVPLRNEIDSTMSGDEFKA